MSVRGFLVALGITALTGTSAPPTLKPEVSVHDPTVAKEGQTYYCFYTGPGILVRTSKDLVNWTEPPSAVFKGPPEWALKHVPKADWFWAPDAKFFQGAWHLYYAISTFGSQVSVIGMATSPTLDPSRPDYKWTDRGLIVSSKRGDGYNAIDPSVVVDPDGSVSMAFGSWNKGIYLLHLDPKTGLAKAGANPTLIAQRGGPNAMEGPALFKKDGYYYLMMSWDLCCRGINSTYSIHFGRSKKVDGPYTDVAGTSLLSGGGTVLLGTHDNNIGPGGQEVLRDGNNFYLIHHYYEKKLNGFPMLSVRKLGWTPAGWPIAGLPVGQKSHGGAKAVLTKLAWRHFVNFGAPARLIFCANGHLDDPKSSATWKLNGNVITMRWPQNDGHTFVDTVVLNPDAQSYEGYNEGGVTLFGLPAEPAKKVSEEKVLPTASAVCPCELR